MGDFFEKTSNGLEALVTIYQHPDKPDVTLLPMIHVADESFYEIMKCERNLNDIVLVEGAEAPFGKGLALAYRVFTRISREKFHPQSGYGKFKRRARNDWVRPTATEPLQVVRTFDCGCGQCFSYDVRFIKADLNAAQSREALSQIPVWKIALGMSAAPFLAVGAAIFFRRKSMINEFSELSDEHSNYKKRDYNGSLGQFKRFVFDARERYLIQILEAQIGYPDNAKTRIGVEYGGGHMPVLHDWLTENGYEIGAQRSVVAIAYKKTDREKDFAREQAYWRLDYARQNSVQALHHWDSNIEAEYKYFEIDFDLVELSRRRLKFDYELDRNEDDDWATWRREYPPVYSFISHQTKNTVIAPKTEEKFSAKLVSKPKILWQDTNQFKSENVTVTFNLPEVSPYGQPRSYWQSASLNLKTFKRVMTQVTNGEISPRVDTLTYFNKT